MSEPNDEARSLRRMVDELRAEPPPELPWDAMERRLMAEIARRDRAQIARAASSSGGLGQAFALAAAAACIVLGGLAAGSGAHHAQAPAATREIPAASYALVSGEAGARGARDLLALQPGDAIETTDTPVTFSRAGAVAWTLAPQSRLVVRSLGADGVGHTVALERGSIRAEVTPRDPAEGLIEAFAVEIENTRVAVHGTAFSVTRDGAQVIVDVEHGSVAVGPTGHVGVTTGHLLVGPRRASFSLDGGRSARFLPREDTARPKPVVASAAPAPAHDDAAVAAVTPQGAREAHPSAPVHAAPPSGSPAEPEPKAAPVEPEPVTLTVAGVRAHLAQCFVKTYDAGDFSVSSTLHLVLRPDGSVKSARFDPPLKPDFQLCAGIGIGGRFAEGGGGPLDIPITMKR